MDNYEDAQELKVNERNRLVEECKRRQIEALECAWKKLTKQKVLLSLCCLEPEPLDHFI
jgi:hypothetical protein